MRSDNVMAAFAHFRTKTNSAIASGQEIEMDNTVNAPYEAVKIYGKSEQKAQWNQAEGVTSQNGEPSPESPVDLISNIPAGSYQIPTENGIYEVTLTEDLRGLDDTYRDFIRFDSVSGTGYLEQNTQLIADLKNYTVLCLNSLTDETLHFVCNVSGIDKSKVQANQIKSTHFPFASPYYHPTQNNIHLYTITDTNNNVFFDIRKENLDITDYSDRAENCASCKRWMNANNPVIITPRTTPLKTSLTFTKVSSSSLPELEIEPHGKNLVTCIESDWKGLGGYNTLTITDGVMTARIGSGGTTRFVFRRRFQPGTYTASAVFQSTPRYIIRLYDASGNLLTGSGISGFGTYNAYYRGFFFDGSVITFTIPSVASSWDFMIGLMSSNEVLVGEETTVSNVQLEAGETASTYEPYRFAPSEALAPSPNYPHQIYDLSNVTLQNRGRNLFDKEWINNIADSSANNKYHRTERVYDVRYPMYYDYLPCITANYPTIKPGNYTIAFDCMIPSNTQNKKTAAVGLRKPPSGEYFLMSGGHSFDLDNNDVWQKVVKSFTVTEETEYALNIQPISISDYSVTVCFKNIQIAEGTYTADTMPPYDKYRCTSATVPIALKSCGEDADYLLSDGQTVKRYQYIRDLVIDGTVNNFVCNMVGSAGDHRCQFYVKNNTVSYDRLKQGSVVKTSHGFAAQAKADGANYLPYLIFSWETLGITTVPTVAQANEAAKSYCAEQNALGTPLIMRYVLYTPVETKITDTWAQNMLALKTAPYYTKLHADKETGGLKACYPSIKKSNEESSIEYLLTSSQEYVITSDEKTMILF